MHASRATRRLVLAFLASATGLAGCIESPAATDGEDAASPTGVYLSAPGPLPRYAPDGDVRILLRGTYAVGSKIEVAIENAGEIAYNYNDADRVCTLNYFDDAGRKFGVAQCGDIWMDAPLAPGERLTLFTWDMHWCTEWTPRPPIVACEKREPLPEGIYHVRATFVSGDGTRRAEAGADFRVAAPATS